MILLITQVMPTHSQTVMSLTQGKRYVVAFPQAWASTSESPFPQPMMLQISSRTKTKVRVTTPAAINEAPRIDKEYILEANRVLSVPVSVAYMNTKSETKTGFGIVVEADAPIWVTTLQQWNGNGETANHLPVEGWGKNYYTMNFYQDRYGTQADGYSYRPSQILVIADNDSTVLSYAPAFDTEGGESNPSVRKGATQTVVLNKGETFLIKSKIDEANNKEWITDLSGTMIRSSKPVGVISGHTKVGILRYPDFLGGLRGSSSAHFVRNNVHDAMLPLEMAGKKFVTVPCRYTSTRVTGKAPAESGAEDDRGDVIRVIALEDSTTVKSLSQDGSSFKNEFILKKGETRIVPSVEVQTYWESDKPILMGQYGKSYAEVRGLGIRGSSKGEESALGHPTVESGMPMLQVVPSVDRYVDYGVFRAPEGMDNFVSIVFKADEITKIKYKGKSLNVMFGGAMRSITGTPYACITSPIGAGEHVIESIDPNVRWAAWTYGSMDGLSQGRAYGTPVAVDVSIPCNDSLIVTDEIDCGDASVKGLVVANGQTCAALYGVIPIELNNYRMEIDTNFASGDSSVTFNIKVIDKQQSASAKVRLVSRSGRYVERQYSFDATKLSVLPDHVQFGTVKRADTSARSLTRELKVSNPYNNRSITIDRVRFLSTMGVFSVDTTGPIKLEASKSRTFLIKAEPRKALTDTIVDSIFFDIGCSKYGSKLSIAFEPVLPVINVSNLSWDNSIDPPNSRRKSIVVRNTGDGDLHIHNYDRAKLDSSDYSNRFVSVTNIDSLLPLIIAPQDSAIFIVQYMPRGDMDILNKDTIIFYSNTRGGDSICYLTGVVWSTSRTPEDVDNHDNHLLSVRPNPSLGEFFVTLPSTPDLIELQVFDILGHVVWQTAINSPSPSMQTTSEVRVDLGALPIGQYVMQSKTKQRIASVSIRILR
ncbi:MAG: T9SS type A sorting domain-containing protein [Candidatus Kapabacteria bacterium]|nr:T9SS type A sorting domain-containing protein [Candidatus Kapabacteria bacterium]